MRFKSKFNKTVLLRERKRNTDRRLSNTPCADLAGGRAVGGGCPPGWGTPTPDLAGGGVGVPWAGAPLAWVPPPHPDLAWGYPRWVSPAGPGLVARPLAGVPLPLHPDVAWGGRVYPVWVPPGWGTLPLPEVWTDRHL